MIKGRRILAFILRTTIGIIAGLFSAIISIEISESANISNAAFVFILWIFPIAIGSIVSGFSNKRLEFKPWEAVLTAIVLLPGVFVFSLIYVCEIHGSCL